VIVCGIAFAINYLINFFITKHITSNIGTDAYGFVTLAKTMSSYALIATLALNSYAARFVSVEYHKGHLEKAKIFFNSVFFGDLILGIGLLCVGGIVLLFSKKWFLIPDNIVDDVKFLFLLIFINLFIDLAGTAFQSAAYIKNKLHLSYAIKCVAYLIEGLFLIISFSAFKPRVSYVGAGLIVATIFCLVSNVIVSRFFVPELTINRKHFRCSAVKQLVVNGVWNSLNSLGNTLNSGLDLIVTNSLLGAISMGNVSVVKTTTAIFNGLFQMAAHPFQPIFLKKYASGEKKSLLESMQYSMKFCGLISNLAFAEVVALGPYYYKLWVPNLDAILLYRLSIVGVASSIIEGAVYPLFYIYTLTIKNKVPCLITIAGGVLNVVGMYILINHSFIGVYAVFLTTTVVMTFINGITNPIYMARCLKLKLSYFYPILLRHLFSCAIITNTLYFLSLFFKISSWITFIIAGIILAVVGGFEHVIIMFGFRHVKRRIFCSKIIQNNINGDGA